GCAAHRHKISRRVELRFFTVDYLIIIDCVLRVVAAFIDSDSLFIIIFLLLSLSTQRRHLSCVLTRA
ncbi:hypothetical protein, partial [Brucella endophytica]